MSTPPSVLLLDDGELDRFAAALRRLGVDFVHLRGRQIGPVVECPTDVLVASLQRTVDLPELDPPAESSEYPIRICVHQQDFLPLRERLRKLGTHFLIHSQVDSETLRLLLLQLLHQGAEQRGAQRLPFGSEVTYRAEGEVHPALLSELSVDSCRLVTSSPLRLDTPVQLQLPRELLRQGGASLTGIAVRCTPCELSQDVSGYNVVLEFANVAREIRAALEEALAGRRLGTRVTPLTPVPDALADAAEKPEQEEDEELPEIVLERRRDHRRLYSRRIAAMTRGGADALDIVLGRDLSVSGIRIAQHPELQVGSRLALAIFGSDAGIEPVVVEAEVANDVGEQGLGLRFVAVTADKRSRLEAILGEIPALEALDCESTQPDRLFLSKVLPSDG